MLLDDIGGYLQTSGVGTLGTDIFLFNLPDSAGKENVVSLWEYSGANPLNAMSSTPGAAVSEFPRLQVLVRNVSAETARTKCNTIWKLLDGYSGTLNSVRYKAIKALGSPSYLETAKYTVSEKIVHLFSMNFEVNKDLT
jgi:hypothetical protein